MDPAPNISGIVGWFVLLFVIAWLFACSMISLMGGWHRLAEKFRAISEIHGEEIRFASMAIGTDLFPARYRRVLFVTVGPAGIGLSVIFFFRALHPPLFIPWSAVESANASGRGWCTMSRLISTASKSACFSGGPLAKRFLKYSMPMRA